MIGAGSGGFILLPVVMALMLLAMLAFELDRQSAIGVEALADDTRMEAARTAAEAGIGRAIGNAYSMGCPGGGNAGTLTGTAGSGSYATTWRFTTASAVTISSVGQSGTATRTLNRNIDAYDPNTFYPLSVVRPDPATPSVVYDSMIAQDGASYNFGSDTRLIVANSGSSTANVLVRFDLAAAGLPSKAKITAAQMTLSRSPLSLSVAPVATLTVRKLTRAWDEGSGAGIALLGTAWSNSRAGVSWNYAQSSPQTAWTAAAGGQTAVGVGDVDLPVDAQQETFATYVSGSPPQVTFDVTPPAVEWSADPTQNFGVLVSSNDALADMPFYSSEATNASYRPALALTYILPCGNRAPPAVALAFADASIAAGDTTTLSVTLSNPNLTQANAAAIAVTLPAGLTVVGSPSNSCGGSVTSAVSGGKTIISLVSGQLPSASNSGGVTTAGTCTIGATVSPAAAGTYTVAVAAGDLTSAFGGNLAGATASVSATYSAPSVSKTFALGNEAWNAARVVITFSNPNTFALSLSGNFVDNFPTKVVGAAAPTSTCGGTAKLVNSGQGVQLSGASLPAASGGVAGTCTLSTPVQIQPVGKYTNVVAAGALSTFLGSNANPASATILPDAADAFINGLFPLNNYGTAPSLPVQEKSSFGQPGRVLVRFDTSAFAAGTVVKSAKVRFYTKLSSPSGKAVTLAAYALPQAWVEGTGGAAGFPLVGADWTASDPVGGKSWPVAGAVNVATATPVATTSVPAADGWIELDVTAQAQTWIAGGVNYGLLLVNQNSNAGQDIVTVSGRTSANAPQLMVSY